MPNWAPRVGRFSYHPPHLEKTNPLGNTIYNAARSREARLTLLLPETVHRDSGIGLGGHDRRACACRPISAQHERANRAPAAERLNCPRRRRLGRQRSPSGASASNRKLAFK